ncbi:MAG: hypothetical protein M3N19_00220, partial [Candidatus Eremiobacteraeota bacterium]|nr:hypothetical protein [Candidatus Eremiobacteraeota bacterium]
MHKERAQGSASVHNSIAAGSKVGRHASAPTPAMTPRQAVPALSAAVRIGAASALAGAPATERRTLRNTLALKIERAFCKPNPPKHASFSLEGERGRVQILLRSAGSATQIVALCPPSAREVVAAALSQARYALALRGISIQTDIRGFVQ